MSNPEATPAAGRTLMIHVVDPMCSWCWGFAPVAARLRDAYADGFEPVLLAGGLSPGTRTPLDAATRAQIREHWGHVQEISGQPFDFSFFERGSFVYDTEPACRALVAARALRPGSEFAMLEALHAAFYADGRDVTDPAVLVTVAVEQGFEQAAFAATLEDPATREATAGEFALTRRLGILGYPALLVGDADSGLTAITVGYQDYAPLAVALDAWREAHPPPS